MSADKLLPNLTVSPSWLSSGDSVTLNCSVKYPDVGWRFYWYKAIPNLSIRFYTKNCYLAAAMGPNSLILLFMDRHRRQDMSVKLREEILNRSLTTVKFVRS